MAHRRGGEKGVNAFVYESIPRLSANNDNRNATGDTERYFILDDSDASGVSDVLVYHRSQLFQILIIFVEGKWIIRIKKYVSLLNESGNFAGQWPTRRTNR